MKEFDKGWALEAWAGVYHFQPISEMDAESLIERREAVYVVETVNFPDAEDEAPRMNRYFVGGLNAAIGMAAKLLGDLRVTQEEIVAIRQAQPDEEALFEAVIDHFGEQIPPAISDAEAETLVGKRRT